MNSAAALLCRSVQPAARSLPRTRLCLRAACNDAVKAWPHRSVQSWSRRPSRSELPFRANAFVKLVPARHQARFLASDPQPKDESNQQPRGKIPLRERIKSLTPHENIYTIPNILTFSRLAAAPLIGYLILHDQHAYAIGLFAYAGITDLIDGWVARTFKQQTVVGTVIDPMADKTLMTILTVTLAIKGALPAWCATIIIGRDVLLAISAIYYRWISLPPPKTFARYWDFSLPSAEVHPTGISKANTALQLGLIGWTVCMPMLTGYGLWVETALTGMQYLVATTTVWSGLSYVYSKDAVKILSKEDIEERQRKAKGED